MNTFLADCRHGVRLLRRTPEASFIALAVLAIGIAFVSTFLSLYIDLYLKPYPGFADSERIATVSQSDGTRSRNISIELIERISDEVASVDAITGVSLFSLDLAPGGEGAQVAFVSDGFFPGLRPKLLLGRGFDERDHQLGAEPVTVISERLWRSAFAGRADIIGQTVRVSGTPFFGQGDGPREVSFDHRIIGVMGSVGSFFSETNLWLPYEQVVPAYIGVALRLSGIARLAPGASTKTLRVELNDRYADSPEEFGLTPGFRLEALRGMHRNIEAQRVAQRQVSLFLIASVLLGLVAAGNVSLFMLARAPTRQREIAIRMAVGAPLKRLVRQLATEAVLLVVAALVLGLMLTPWLVAFIQEFALFEQTQWNHVTLIDWRVLASMGVSALFLTGLVSLWPILDLKRIGSKVAGHAVSARAGRIQRNICWIQIAAAGAFAGVGIAFVWYLAELLLVDRGYDATDIYVVTVAANPGPPGGVEFETIFAERARTRERILAIPEVQAVAFGSEFPGRRLERVVAQMQLPADPDETIQFPVVSIDETYVDLLGMQLVDGQNLTYRAVDGVLVNETLARLLWGHTNIAGEAIPVNLFGQEQVEVFGVLRDVPFEHPADAVRSRIFMLGHPFSDSDAILVRTSMPALDLADALRQLVDSGDLDVEVSNVQALAELTGSYIVADRERAILTALAAAVIVALAALGYYGMQQYLVLAGRRNYAIRASVGAGPSAIWRLVVWRGLLLSLPGLLVGGLLAFIAVGWLRDDFISRSVSPALVAVSVLIGLTALLLSASLGPAGEARRTLPAPLLRQD